MKKLTVILAMVLFLFGSIGSSYADLVGYWDFDENTGNIAYDNSGHNNDGDILNGATWVPGVSGSALSFDGIDDYVNVPNSQSIDLPQWTVSFWAMSFDWERTQAPLDKRNGQYDRTYGFAYYSDDSHPPDEYLSVNIGDGTFHPTDFDYAAYAPVSLTEDKFYFIAATYDQSTLKLYLDGQLLATNVITMPGITGDGYLHIGTHGTMSSPFFGVLDEVRIYDSALSQNEILADMTAPVPEPTTILLLSSGIIGLAAFRKRFRKS